MSFVYIVLLSVIVFLLDGCRRQFNTCGIPVIEWIEIFFTIKLAKSILDTNVLWIYRIKPTVMLKFIQSTSILQYLAFFSWTVHGLQLYFDKRNNCQQFSDTQKALIVMLIILFFWTLLLVFAVFLLSWALIYLICNYETIFGTARNTSGSAGIISQLKSSSYTLLQTQESMCSICQQSYQPQDVVTIL